MPSLLSGRYSAVKVRKKMYVTSLPHGGWGQRLSVAHEDEDGRFRRSSNGAIVASINEVTTNLAEGPVSLLSRVCIIRQQAID